MTDTIKVDFPVVEGAIDALYILQHGSLLKTKTASLKAAAPTLSQGGYAAEVTSLLDDIDSLASSVDDLHVKSLAGIEKIRALFAEADRA